MSITNVLTDPNESFNHRAENPGLLRPLGVVFLAAVAAIIAPLLSYREFLAAGAPPLAVFGQAGSIIFAFFGQFVAWIVFAIVFYLFSIAVGGSGSLGDTLKLNGWGFVPAIIAGIVSGIGQFIALQNVAVPDLPQNFNQETATQFAEALTNFQMAIQSEPAVRIASLIVILLTIWQAVIWAHATMHARDLSLRGATIAVGVPIGVFVLFNLYNLLNGWVI
ncbi:MULTISPECIES: Yip1 family protein [Halococcus]|uniref:Yip1 domain-containing protein n=1 Tax=Halococcus salifodinae DSM 8989 TaxID=1227456 RepID=M0N149_9EURY|nr:MULTISPECIES: Yip1 family protein [Halococcus]EMA51278.1 hypothetical protein C450_12410 [Halococcus salifodinae DSM 8989]